MPTVQKKSPAYRIKLGDRFEDDARLLRLKRGIHPEHIDTAEIELMPRLPLSNVSVRNRFESVACKIYMDVQGTPDTLIHAGIIAGGDVGYNETGDVWIKKSRHSNELFGDPLDQIWVAYRYPSEQSNVASWGSIQVDGDAVFNPVFDGRIQPNMSILFDQSVPSNRAFVDIDSLPQNVQGVQPWTLLDATWYLIQTLNPNETHVINPQYNQISNVISNQDTILTNLEIPKGSYLPVALKKLLEPYGYQMRTVYGAGDKPYIYINKRNDGDSFQLKGQALNTQADLDISEVHEIDVNYERVKSSAKYIRIIGDYERRESTFELIPGWSHVYDDLYTEPDKLQLGSDYIKSNPGAEFAWRRWVLNEAGDHNGTGQGRSFPAWFANHFFELKPNLQKRRQFLPTIIEELLGGAVGIHDGTLIEWYHPEKSGWHSITGNENTSDEYVGLKQGTSVRLLENECGIYFTSQLPPLQLMAFGLEQGTNVPRAKIRITASLLGDQRVRYEETTRSDMINQKVEVIKMPSFKLRVVDQASKHFPYKNTSLYKNTEKDDRQAIKDLAAELSDNWGHSNISANVKLIGVDYELDDKLGRPVEGINGRNVWFVLDPQQRKYPTLLGWEMDYQNQTTTLQIGTLRGRTV